MFLDVKYPLLQLPADPLDVIDVDWSGLLPKHPKEPREPGAALLKFTPGAVMLRVGISKKLAGSELFTKVKETCQRLLEKPKGNFILLCLIIICYNS